MATRLKPGANGQPVADPAPRPASIARQLLDLMAGCNAEDLAEIDLEIQALRGRMEELQNLRETLATRIYPGRGGPRGKGKQAERRGIVAAAMAKAGVPLTPAQIAKAAGMPKGSVRDLMNDNAEWFEATGEGTWTLSPSRRQHAVKE